ncbi:MAG TPA: hypothetical protein VJ997_00670 [Longimicrobiales bacterium]|nr:hypothetical protein [Longimicrobiales bacterium]
MSIHPGRPIFYGLGNFVFRNEIMDPMPSDNHDNFDLGAVITCQGGIGYGRRQ